jgi:transposase
LGAVFTDRPFSAPLPRRGQPAAVPWRLAPATILQFAEGFSGLRAADAVRARPDWRHALRPDLGDLGFDGSVPGEFHGRVAAGAAERHLLGARGRRRTDATRVLAAARARDRLAVVGETPRHTPDSLAAADWLRIRCRPVRGDRSGRRLGDAGLPKAQAARAACPVLVGGDGRALLAAPQAPGAPARPRRVPAVEALRRVLVRRFRPEEGAPPDRAALPGPAALAGATTRALTANVPYPSTFGGCPVLLTPTGGSTTFRSPQVPRPSLRTWPLR